MSRFNITIDSDLAGLFLVSLVVRGICDHIGIGADEAFSVELCVVEAMTNSIKHAYRGEPGHDVSLEVSLAPQRLDMIVRDQGLSMPEEQRAKLENGSGIFDFDPVDVQSLPEGGMGLELIRLQMDETAYSVDGGSNSLRLTKFLPPAAVRLKEPEADS